MKCDGNITMSYHCKASERFWRNSYSVIYSVRDTAYMYEAQNITFAKISSQSPSFNRVQMKSQQKCYLCYQMSMFILQRAHVIYQKRHSDYVEEMIVGGLTVSAEWLVGLCVLRLTAYASSRCCYVLKHMKQICLTKRTCIMWIMFQFGKVFEYECLISKFTKWNAKPGLNYIKH